MEEAIYIYVRKYRIPKPGARAGTRFTCARDAYKPHVFVFCAANRNELRLDEKIKGLAFNLSNDRLRVSVEVRGIWQGYGLTR